MAFAAISGRNRRAAPGAGGNAGLRARLGRSSDFVELRLVPSLVAPNPSMLARIVRIGLPSAGEQLALRVGLVLYTVTIAALGTRAFAAHQIALSILNMSFVIGQAYGIAAASLTGQALGRKDPALARKAAALARRQGTVIATTVGVLLVITSYSIHYTKLYEAPRTGLHRCWR